MAPAVTIEPRGGLLDLRLGTLWSYRELLYFLVWRDVKLRYQQTAMGVLWVLLQPVLTLLIVTVVFGRFVQVPLNGVPYAVFALPGILPWMYFSQAVAVGTLSLVIDQNLVTKVYFPRLLIPLAKVLRPVVDLGLSFLVLAGLMAWFQVAPSWRVLTVPLFVLLAIAAALAVSLWLSPINVRYRDVGHAMPFLLQIWMFISPVIYPAKLVPGPLRFVFALNPVAGVIEGFRWAILPWEPLDLQVLGASVLTIAVLLVTGLVLFRWSERTFADVV